MVLLFKCRVCSSGPKMASGFFFWVLYAIKTPYVKIESLMNRIYKDITTKITLKEPP